MRQTSLFDQQVDKQRVTREYCEEVVERYFKAEAGGEVNNDALLDKGGNTVAYQQYKNQEKRPVAKTELVLTDDEFRKLHTNVPGPSGKMGGYQQMENLLIELGRNNPKTRVGQSYVIALEPRQLDRLDRYLRSYGSGGPNGRLRSAFGRVRAFGSPAAIPTATAPVNIDEPSPHKNEKVPMRKKKKVVSLRGISDVTLILQQSDLDDAICGSPTHCAIAIAFARTFPGCRPIVNPNRITVTHEGWVYHFETTNKALKSIEENDDRTLSFAGGGSTLTLILPRMGKATRSTAGLNLDKTRDRIRKRRNKDKEAGIPPPKYKPNLRRLAARRAGAANKKLIAKGAQLSLDGRGQPSQKGS